MGKRKLLSQFECGRIDAYLETNASKREIARLLGRSVTCITTYLRDRAQYGRNFRGSAPKLTQRCVRRVANMARNKQISARKIKDELQLPVSTSTIRRTLKKSSIKRLKMKAQPRLSTTHKNNRLRFCKTNMKREWKQVWFSDEKKMNLDGPDGFSYYWHDLRTEPRFSLRHGGGPSVMEVDPVSWFEELAHTTVEVNCVF